MNSIGKDLATIRVHLNLMVEDIHRMTRIPLETLKRIESDAIFIDKDENQTYIRSFVRTYAKAMKISDSLASQSLDQHEAGTYNGLLLQAYPDIRQKGNPPHPMLDESASDSSTTAEKKPASKEQASKEQVSKEKPSAETKASDAAADIHSESTGAKHADGRSKDSTSADGRSKDSKPAGKGGSTSADYKASRTTDSKSADSGAKGRGSEGAGITDPKSAHVGAKGGEAASSAAAGAKSTDNRTEDPKTPHARSKHVDWAEMGYQFMDKEMKSSPVWLIVAAVIVVVSVASFFFIFDNEIFSSDLNPSAMTAEEPLSIPDRPEESGLNLDLITDNRDQPEAAEAEPEVEAVTLEETLYLTIYAAHDRLDPVRVWSDLKPRQDPYWLEHGEAYRFEFRDSIKINGSYSRMLLFLNGHRIDNAREEHYNAGERVIELTRDLFTSENTGTRWAIPVELDLPDDVAEPDTIRDRPSFN